MAYPVPARGTRLGATNVMRTVTNAQGHDVNYRLLRYFISYVRSYQGSTLTDVYTYGNIAQRQVPALSSSWYDVPLSAWPGYTYTPDTFTSPWPPAIYGWRAPAPTPATTKKKTTTKKPTSSSGSKGNSGTKSAPKTGLYTNPPLHAVTLGRSPYFNATNSTTRRLGLISVPDQQMQVPGAVFSKKWGFRFQYNPTSVIYSQDQNASIDPKQIAASNTRLLIPGTTSYAIELYLNRIADMKKSLQQDKYYTPRPLHTDLQQIWLRGTEYDLDFLYRVINGDPVNVKGWRKTANTGLLFKQRVDMRIGDGLFISGTIDHIDVTHVMFTEMMVPTLTKVSLQVTQMIPDY
jgi:hypothetical protein